MYIFITSYVFIVTVQQFIGGLICSTSHGLLNNNMVFNELLVESMLQIFIQTHFYLCKICIINYKL